MHEYEIVYIFRSSQTSEEIESKLESFHAHLTGGEGQISAVEHWGKRQLAYPIEKERTGYYVVAQFESEPTVLPEFERMLKLDEQLLRYLIVLSEGELPFPPSMRRAQEGSDARYGGPREAPEGERPASAEAEGRADAGAEHAGEPDEAEPTDDLDDSDDDDFEDDDFDDEDDDEDEEDDDERRS